MLSSTTVKLQWKWRRSHLNIVPFFVGSLGLPAGSTGRRRFCHGWMSKMLSVEKIDPKRIEIDYLSMLCCGSRCKLFTCICYDWLWWSYSRLIIICVGFSFAVCWVLDVVGCSGSGFWSFPLLFVRVVVFGVCQLSSLGFRENWGRDMVIWSTVPTILPPRLSRAAY